MDAKRVHGHRLAPARVLRSILPRGRPGCRNHEGESPTALFGFGEERDAGHRSGPPPYGPSTGSFHRRLRLGPSPLACQFRPAFPVPPDGGASQARRGQGHAGLNPVLRPSLARVAGPGNPGAERAAFWTPGESGAHGAAGLPREKGVRLRIGPASKLRPGLEGVELRRERLGGLPTHPGAQFGAPHLLRFVGFGGAPSRPGSVLERHPDPVTRKEGVAEAGSVGGALFLPARPVAVDPVQRHQERPPQCIRVHEPGPEEIGAQVPGGHLQKGERTRVVDLVGREVEPDICRTALEPNPLQPGHSDLREVHHPALQGRILDAVQKDAHLPSPTPEHRNPHGRAHIPPPHEGHAGHEGDQVVEGEGGRGQEIRTFPFPDAGLEVPGEGDATLGDVSRHHRQHRVPRNPGFLQHGILAPGGHIGPHRVRKGSGDGKGRERGWNLRFRGGRKEEKERKEQEPTRQSRRRQDPEDGPRDPPRNGAHPGGPARRRTMRHGGVRVSGCGPGPTPAEPASARRSPLSAARAPPDLRRPFPRCPGGPRACRPRIPGGRGPP